MSEEVKTVVFDHDMDHPCYGALRVEQELRLKGIPVSPGDVLSSGSATSC